MTENIKILALRLPNRFDEHISAQLLLLRYNWDGDGRTAYFSGFEGPTGFTGLHGAAFLGIAKMVPTVLEMNEGDFNIGDGLGMTALTWASVRGHEDVVKILLELEDVNPNQADARYHRTPLSWAAGQGHKEIVKTLLEREEVNPHQRETKSSYTPLSWAAKNGDEGMVRYFWSEWTSIPTKQIAGHHSRGRLRMGMRG